MTSEITEFSNERQKRKALNFQNDKVRNRLFDISLAISNSIYNKTITSYEANKYLQEVRKYKKAHLWDNQTTEMSEKLITQLKIILSWNSLSSHKYSTRFRNPKTQSDSSNEDTAYETVDDMIDYFRQNKNHEQVSDSLCNKDDSGYKKTEEIKNKNQSSKKIKRTDKKHISRKQKLVKNKHKTKLCMTKSNNDEYANTDLLHVSPIDCSSNTFSSIKKDNNLNIASTTKKYLSQTIANSFNTNTNLETILGETHIESVKTLKEQVANDHVFALHLSQRAIDTNAMKRILDRECNSSIYQNVPGNNKLAKNGNYTGINFSFDCQDMKDTMNLCTTSIFNQNDINNDRNKENKSEDIIPLNLSQKLQKINNNHSSKHCSQETIMHSGQIHACNNGNLIRTFLNDSNIGSSKISHNGKLFHNNKSLSKQKTKKNIKPLLSGTISKCKGNSTIKETTNPKAKLLKIDGKKRGRPKKKNINGTINHETNLNNAIPNEVISLINSIKYVREIDEEENCMDIELPEEFWNNFDLPPDWDEQDLIF